MTIRVLCCSGSLDGGGSERQLWQLATQLDTTEFAAQIYLHYRRGSYLTQVRDRIPIHAFWDDRQPKRGLPGSIHRRQVEHLRECILAHDIDVVYDRTFHMTLVTGPACQRAGCPRVSVIVSPPSRDFGQANERFAWFKRRQLAQAYSDPQSTTLAVSEAVAEDAAQFYGIPKSKIQVLPSPVDREGVLAAAQRTDTLASESSITQQTRRVAVVGRLSAEKGQRLAIEAFAHAVRQTPQSNWRLDLIGDGPDRSQLFALSEQLGLDRQVAFHGHLDNPFPWLAAADVLLIPSLYEGLPNVALEAMVLGTAVLATNCSPSLEQLLGRGQRGLTLDSRSSELMAQRIEERFQHTAAWNQRLTAADEYVREYHDLPAWLRRMESLFREQVGDGTRASVGRQQP